LVVGEALAAAGAMAAFGLALLLLLPVAARGQQPSAAEPPSAEEPAPDPEAPPDAGAGESRFAEVITVTANKREEDVREVGSSVTVVAQDHLESLSADQLTDFAAYVPGLQVTSLGTPGQTTVSLRGIAPISSGATVATYLGESPLGSSGIYQRETAFALDLLPYDLERVEVLRGPQGTLYGAGAMGGLLKYVPRAPDPSSTQIRFGGGVSDVEGAGDAGGDLYLSANVPLVADRVALRASYARNDIAGYIDNGLNGEENINDGLQESARVAMLWQADKVRFQLDVMRQEIDSDNNAAVALAPGTLRPLTGDLENDVAVDSPFRKEIDVYLATLDLDLGWAALTSATGYSETATRQRQDATFLLRELLGPSGISFFDLGLDLEKLTQELRLTSTTGGRFDWQLGAFYSDEKAENSQIIRVQDASGAPVPGLDPLADLALPSDYEELAAFANVSFQVSDRFDLDLGARFSRNEQTFAQVVTGGILVPLGTTPGASEEDVFTWSLGPKLHLTDDALLYARVATGYQPGGPNVALPNVPPAVDASRLTSYELGLKSELAGRRWLLDIAGFYIDWTDIQIGASVGATSFLVNGGEAVSQGVEVATAFNATDRLRLGWNGAYTDATVSNDVPSLGGREGDHLPYIPERSWSATADYYFGLGRTWSGHAGGGYRWVDDRKSSLDSNPDALPLDSYSALDLGVDVFNARWSLRVYGKNVTDERAYLTIDAVASVLTGVTRHVMAVPIQPRTFGIELGITF
jgi:outer membrane receptor protein involved in Fe transport